MAKKNRRKQIPKNKDIEEMQETQGKTEEINTMQDVIDLMDKPKRELKAKKEAMKKRLQQVYARKDAQVAEDKRKEVYQKAVSKIEKQEEER